MNVPRYLPFLDGPALVAPRMKPINEADWLPPHKGEAEWLQEKRSLLTHQADQVFAIHDWAEDAATSAAGQVTKHLNQFRPDLPELEAGLSLKDVSQYVSDDLCVMVNRDGLYCLGAAILCAPTFWALVDKAGKPLGGLHEEVPGGDPELASRISRIFSNLPQNAILERFNWTVQLGPERFTPSSGPMKARLREMEPEAAARELYLRVERQTIRKLDDGSSVLFTIRILIDPLPPLLERADHRTAFEESWNRTAADLASYKGWPHYEAAVRCLMAAG